MFSDSVYIVSDLAADLLKECAPWANPVAISQFLNGTVEVSRPHVFILRSEDTTNSDLMAAVRSIKVRACVLTYSEEMFMQPLLPDELFSHYLAAPVNSALLRSTLQSVRDSLEKDLKLSEMAQRLKQESTKLKQLNEIGQSLSSIADPYVLMNLILRKSRELTNADAGSVCVIRYDNEGKPSRLLFSYFQNDTLNQDAKVNLDLPVSKSSLAGYVAVTGECLQIQDAYDIPADREYSFNSNIDKSTGYRTKSMLVHPMIDNEAKILGVVQLLNKKSWSYQALADGKLNVEQVESFSEEDVEIISSLTSQAAICLKNTTLIQDIQNLFEGFVNASVTAIEQRDPTTSGHSFRVALMTCELAKACAKVAEGPYARLQYSDLQLQEIRYASLLHDFGKIGVREQVLVKAKKLYPYEMDLIRARFEYILKEAEAAAYTKKAEMVQSMGYDMACAHFGEIEAEQATQIAAIEDILYFIMQTNEPTVLEEGNFQRLLEIAEKHFLDPYGNKKPFLTEREVEALSIRRGSITAEERKEIESHVTHSFTFLSKIPWTTGLKQVPAIAYGHHEWLSGDGYPNQLAEEEILAQSKMMAIADIYDALTAADRPYKKAIPVEKALAILKMEVDRKHLDGNLVGHFIDFNVFKVGENL